MPPKSIVRERPAKDPRFDLRTIFLANSGGLSSKRILGVFGFLVCLILLVISFILEREVP